MAATMTDTTTKPVAYPGTEDGSSRNSRQTRSNSIEKDNPPVPTASSCVAPEDAQQISTNEIKYAHGMRLFMILTSLLVTFFTVLLDTSIIATAIPKITNDFRELGDVSWYGAAFMMTMGGTQSAWGKVYKYFPPKTGFLLAVLIFEAASAVCGASPNSTVLIIGRALAGVGAAGIASGTFTVLALVIEPKQLAAFTGITALTNGIASAAGPLIGGALSDTLTWRWCFYINLPIGAVAAPLIVLFLRISPRETGQDSPDKTRLRARMMQIDPVGIVLVMVGIVAFIQALHFGGSSLPWSSATVLGLLVGSAALGIVFFVWEWWQGEQAAIPPRLMADRHVLVNSLYTALFGGAYFTIIYYLPIYFQSVDNVSATMSGVRNLPLIISISATILVSSASVSRTGPKPLMLAGAVLATAGCGLLCALDVGSGTGKWVGYQLLAGIGFGLSFQLVIINVQAAVDPMDIGPATAIVLFFQTVGAAFFLAAAQAAFLNQLLVTLRTSAPGVDPAMLIATGSAELRKVFTVDEMPGILVAYMAGLRAAFALSTGASGLAVFVAVFSSPQNLSAHSSAPKSTEDMKSEGSRKDGQEKV